MSDPSATSSEVGTISTAWAIVLLFLCPSRLTAHSVEHAINMNRAMMAPGHAMTLEAENTNRTNFTRFYGRNVSLMRRSLWISAAIVVGAIVGAVITALILGISSVEKTLIWNALLQYGGIGVLLWATLARAESAIETLDGWSLPERVDAWLYRFLYIVGSYALALSVAWY